MITIASIGGILLCVGALFTIRGLVYYAVATYLFADLCWIALAYSKGDIQGVVFTCIGTLLGIAAMVKMRLGKMKKTLLW